LTKVEQTIDKMKTVPLLFVLSLILLSCGDKENHNSENKVINDWILGNMSNVYYWNKYIPSNYNIYASPEKFFKSLLYKDDRYSWIKNDKDYINGYMYNGEEKSFGYEINLYHAADNPKNLVAQVIYVQKNSPAFRAGIIRGNFFNKVNGTPLTTDNYSSLLSTAENTVSLNLVYLDRTDGIFKDSRVVDLTAEVLYDDPIILYTIYTLNNIKIGYLVYKQFLSDDNMTPSLYDNELASIFEEFKAKGITQLVLDLRFNQGGLFKSCQKL
jgi:carboxyl-terminal processing protease